MVRIIAKLTKTVEKRDLQIAFLMNKVETQAQNTIALSQVLTYPLKIASLSNAPHSFKPVWVEKQIVEFVLMTSLFVQQIQGIITNIIKA